MNKHVIVGDVLQSSICIQSSVIAIGKFTIIHQGHLKILHQLSSLSLKHEALPIIFSFIPQPNFIFSREKPIFSIRSRLCYLKKFFGGKKFVFFLQRFNKRFISLSPEEFILQIKDVFNIKCIIIGENFHFGKNGQGDSFSLVQIGKKYNLEIKVVKMFQEKNTSLSTTLLKSFLTEGYVDKFNSLTLSKYFLEGPVISGKQIAGKKLGFKTANIKLKNFLYFPKFGVYICKCVIESELYEDQSQYYGIANIGIKPTLSSMIPEAEIHLFNFSQNIYGKKIKIFPIKFMREEKKFDSLDFLKNQILEDILFAKNWLNKEGYNF